MDMEIEKLFAPEYTESEAAKMVRPCLAGELELLDLDTLAKLRHDANQHAAATLALGGEGADHVASRNAEGALRALTVSEELQLVLFHAQKLPQLCQLCDAPYEVLWTAIMFYRRFFLVCSVMEFDPFLVMLAALHLACKVEEVHEITLDILLEKSTIGSDGRAKAQISALELPILEALKFNLLLEPKPHISLEMLREECKQIQTLAGSPVVLSDEAWLDVISHAEDLTLCLGVSTDAIFRWPASAIVLACLWEALTVALEPRIKGSLHEFLEQLLSIHMQNREQRGIVRRFVEEVLEQIDWLRNHPGAAGPAASADMKVLEKDIEQITHAARHCQRFFDVLRIEAARRREEKRQERKRRWSEMKSTERSRQQRLFELQLRIATPSRHSGSRPIAATCSNACASEVLNEVDADIMPE